MKNAKVLFCCLGEEQCNENVVRHICEKLHADKIWGVYSSRATKFKPENKYEILFDFWEIIACNYDQWIDPEATIYPLDDTVWDIMSKYMPQLLDNAGRCGLQYRDYELRKDFVYDHIRFWYGFLKREEITHVIFSAIPHDMYDLVVYYLCLEMGILTCVNDTMLKIHSQFEVGRRRIFMKDISYNDTRLQDEYQNTLKLYQDKEESEINLSPDIEAAYQQAITNLVKNTSGKYNKSITLSGREKQNERYLGKKKLSFKNIPPYAVKAIVHEILRYHWACKNRKLTDMMVEKYNELAKEPDYNCIYIYIFHCTIRLKAHHRLRGEYTQIRNYI
jgi:hypothetical protein